MKNFRLYLICISILFTSIMSDSHAQELKITRNGNLRSGPSTIHEIIGKVTSDMKVIRLEKADDWYKVKLPNQEQGWINKILITKVEPVYGDKTFGIHVAAKSNDIEKIRDIISNGGNINARDKQNRTALHWAVSNGHNDLAKVLVDAGADIDVKDKWGGGNTPIEYTLFDVDAWNKNMNQYSKYGMGSNRLWNKELFDLLIEHNAKVRPKRLLLKAVPSNDPRLLDHISSTWNVSVPKDDERYVYSAAVRGAHESLKWLIDRGAEINKPQEDPNNFTPLHIAVIHGDIKAINILLNAGAYKSILMKDEHGRTPLGVTDNSYIHSILTNAIPPDVSSSSLSEIIKKSCLKIREFNRENIEKVESRVFVKNGNYKFPHNSVYNTPLIVITGNQGGLQATGGIPGGMGKNYVYQFINKSTIIINNNKVIFEGDANDPITFVLTEDKGLVYREGKGKVTINDAKSVILPCVE